MARTPKQPKKETARRQEQQQQHAQAHDTQPRAEKRIDPDAVQRAASDPRASVWVTASAGAGKTKVLTDRVLRLLLDGAAPEDILCITFTNAAASVMKNRIRAELAKWATMDDAALDARLQRLTGTRGNDERRADARRLLATFLNAGPRMRIQTIHSFAQDLLRRFPIESGIPPYFDVIDEDTARQYLREAQADILNAARAQPHSPLAEAMRVITAETGEDEFMSLIGEITARRGQFKATVKTHGGLEKTIDATADYLNVPLEITHGRQAREELVSDRGLSMPPDYKGLAAAAAILDTGSDSDKERARLLRAFIDNPDRRSDLYDAYRLIFLTDGGDRRKTLATKKAADAIPVLEEEARRLIEGEEIIRNVNIARGTAALLTLSQAVLTRYEEKKRKLNKLDYDDLIYQAGRLMQEQTSAAWILQKLEGNLRHILIDEAQDTNPEQWKLVSSIADEFFGGRARIRKGKCTMFVVGDEKQSIFSFQQADPHVFDDRLSYFEKLVTSTGNTFRHVQMETTFRSSPAIMTAVDAVFANPVARDGLTMRENTDISHKPFRQGQGGIVEVYPVIRPAADEDTDKWPLPLTRRAADDPRAKLADAIAEKIDGWLKSGEQLDARGRPITPADILILVRRRSAFVDHMVRALKKRDIPVAGADRLTLNDQIAVKDLVALGQFVLQPSDDYALACVLKSPLLGFDDAALEKLAVGRKGTLWDALQQQAAAPRASAALRSARDYLQQQIDASENESVYGFYSNILMNPCPADPRSGLLAMYKRLSFEAEDAIVEFMNAIERYETSHTALLQGYLGWLTAGDAEVKRELSMNAANPRVHIMTVHGAKGLEAPVVMLADTTGLPSDNPLNRPKFLWPDDKRPVPLWAPRAELESGRFSEDRAKVEQEQDREYRRLLYVAMTRAADRLYVFGVEGAKARSEDSWYELIREGMISALGDTLDITDHAPPGDDDLPADGRIPDNVTLTLRLTQGVKPVDDGMRAPPPRRKTGVPAWARSNPAQDKSPALSAAPLLRPSSLAADFKAAVEKTSSARSPLASVRENKALTIGTAVHALFEILPALPHDARADAATRYLAKPIFGIDAATRERLVTQTVAIMNDPAFGDVFGASARAEVAIAGTVYRNGVKHRLSGQIDRLIVTDKAVTIVDFKSNARPPSRLPDVPDDYVLQMALYRAALQRVYPDKKVECALLWTTAPRLQKLPAKMMDARLAATGVHFTPDDRPVPPAPRAPARKTLRKTAAAKKPVSARKRRR